MNNIRYATQVYAIISGNGVGTQIEYAFFNEEEATQFIEHYSVEEGLNYITIPHSGFDQDGNRVFQVDIPGLEGYEIFLNIHSGCVITLEEALKHYWNKHTLKEREEFLKEMLS